MDVLLAVEDLKEFHAENFLRNKAHYTIMNRMTRNKVGLYF
jgi:hypothetical protein